MGLRQTHEITVQLKENYFIFAPAKGPVA